MRRWRGAGRFLDTGLINEQKSGDVDTLPVNNKKSGNADQADLDGLHGLFHVWELSVIIDVRCVIDIKICL